MSHDWVNHQRRVQVEDRIRELTELGEELRRARAVRPRWRWRRRLGALLIAAGRRVGGPALEPAGTEVALALARKG
jgi:hypothetical protein